MRRELIPQRIAPLERNSIRFLRLLVLILKRPSLLVKPSHAEPSLHCPVVHDTDLSFILHLFATALGID